MYENLDNDEMLRAALDAINQSRNAEAMSLLKTLVHRDPGNVFGHYLLAAEHMQLGLVDRAEEGFQRVVGLAPDFPMARFQLGQLYLVKGEPALATSVLAPLASLPAGTALSSYAKGLMAAAADDAAGAIDGLRAGLACEQDVPALASDMQRLLADLESSVAGAMVPDAGLGAPNAAPLYLSGYGKPAY